MSRFLRTLFALAFLGLSWLWETLGPIVRVILDHIPLEGLKRAIVRFMDRLGPYPTLVVFLIPLVASEPPKLLAIWFAAQRQFLLAAVLFIFAEVLRYGLVAFLFTICKDKLLTIPWFAWIYVRIVALHHWARVQVAPLKAWIGQALAEAGIGQGQGSLMRRTRALWRFARRRRA